MKVDVAVLGSPSLLVHNLRPLHVDAANTEEAYIASEPRSCVKVQVPVLGSPSLIVFTVSVDVKQHLKK